MEEIINLPPVKKTRDFKKIFIHLTAIIIVAGLFYGTSNKQRCPIVKNEDITPVISPVVTKEINPPLMVEIGGKDPIFDDVQGADWGPVNSIARETPCSSESCLYRSDSGLEGYGKLKGYYVNYQAVDWGEEKVVCSALLITGGTKELTNDFKENIRRGNTLNKLSRNNELLVNIDLDKMDKGIKEKVLTSKPGQEVKLDVIRRFEDGMSVSTCYSLIDIIKVE